MANRRAKAAATIAELAVTFPAAFTFDPARVRPLKLGIREDLRAQSMISHSRLRVALVYYCNSLPYLESSTESATRIDLAGEPAGFLTPTEAETARQRLTEIAKVPPAGKKKVASQHSLAGSKRGLPHLTLDDLQQAAKGRGALGSAAREPSGSRS
jgi:ProP effector